MSARHITIAKAAFAAALLRPDVTKIHSDDLNRFHDLFEVATSRCTPRNVQSCKEWVLENVFTSAPRTTAFGKYLISFSKHVRRDSDFVGGDMHARQMMSRTRLHIFYVLNDILHHGKHHRSDQSEFSTFKASLQASLPELLQSVVSNAKTRVVSRLDCLLDTWEEGRYYAAEDLASFRQALGNSPVTATRAIRVVSRPPASHAANKELPFIMPASHGDASVPYYDLPAGNLLPHIMPNSSSAIRVDQVCALQLTAGPADASLANTVRDFLEDVKNIDHAYLRLHDTKHADIDSLGQITLRDAADETSGETYYGWSRAFCEKMKKRKEGDQHGDDDRYRSRRRDRSNLSSKSGSESPRKRHRYSGSESDRSGSGRSAYRSGRRLSRNRNGARGRSSDSDYRSKSPGRDGTTLKYPSGPVTQPPQGPRYPSNGAPVPVPPQVVPYAMQQMPQVFPPLSMGPNGLPILPPRPLNWVGQWPPPPPPPLLPGVGFAAPAFPRGTLPSFPPPPQHGQNRYSGHR